MSEKDVNKVLDLLGAVRRKKTDEYGRNNYGIEFFDDDRKILSGIRKFMESQKKTPKKRIFYSVIV